MLNAESERLLEAFRSLRVWVRRSERAPHKPLLVLLALGKWVRGDRSGLPFRDIEKPLSDLLDAFGPPRRSVHPEYPFWRLQHDDLWEVTANGSMAPRASNTDPKKTDLRAKQARGQFAPAVIQALEADQRLAFEIARAVLDQSFPESLHEDILEAVGLPLELGEQVHRRTSQSFRHTVLEAYRSRCAVCGFSLRMGPAIRGVDVAHVQWRQAGGPDTVGNGVALCALHRRLFDLGAFSLDPTSLEVVVSDEVEGTGLEETLARFHGQRILGPDAADHQPHPSFIEWHRRQVFRGRHAE